jgi:hypothetical protein
VATKGARRNHVRQARHAVPAAEPARIQRLDLHGLAAAVARAPLERVHEQQVLPHPHQNHEGPPQLVAAYAGELGDSGSQGAQARPGDSAAVQADKQAARDLIGDIDALADILETLPAWTNPF